MKKYTNCYGNTYKFTETSMHDILVSGNFDHSTIRIPNDYTVAYAKYYADICPNTEYLSLEQFIIAVHEYDRTKNCYTDFAKKYKQSITTDYNRIQSVDPPGGPYIAVGMSLEHLGFDNFIIDSIQRSKSGYVLITQKCDKCGQAGGIHKMSCSSTKCVVLL